MWRFFCYFFLKLNVKICDDGFYDMLTLKTIYIITLQSLLSYFIEKCYMQSFVLPNFSAWVSLWTMWPFYLSTIKLHKVHNLSTLLELGTEDEILSLFLFFKGEIYLDREFHCHRLVAVWSSVRLYCSHAMCHSYTA